MCENIFFYLGWWKKADIRDESRSCSFSSAKKKKDGWRLRTCEDIFKGILW